MARRLCAALTTALMGAAALVCAGTTSAPPMTAVAVTAGPQPGAFTGSGFDTCTAPSSAAMQAWLQSPYRAVGIYFGGVSRGCAQPNLTKDWVATQLAAGWRLIPLYVGLQAPCTSHSQRIDPARAAEQGRAEADDAALQARNLGLATGSVLIVDIEAYPTTDPVCTQAVNTYVSAWTVRLHDHGFFSGFYSSLSSGVAQQVAAYNAPGHVPPDYLDFAKWDGVPTVEDSTIPASYWAPKRRMKQYLGDHFETWGGVTINIDSNYLDMAPLPAIGDFNGNGWSDVMYRDAMTGELYLQPGNGTTLAPRIPLGGGWRAMDAIIRAGNFDRAGGEDVITREAATGYLWLYPGTGAGTLASRVRIGTGWTGLREITPIGDYNRDGYPDLIAGTSTGALYLYPGRGNSFGSRVLLSSSGWTSMDELAGGPDLDGDGYVDLIARQTKTGDLYRYPVTTAGKLGSAVKVGSGWTGRRNLTQVGDFDRDGRADLVAIESATGTLYRYRWLGSGWSGPIFLSKRSSALQKPLL
ncbi:glycoside hydrolase domain-containing protein [Micromonospora inositola]|uniref:Repeat domain-containing protein n=1 Tax=Micromonospora inositola TaxID=47865 RepID=A0A1C5HYM7_9ACTN|nr:glycoside hydrolase domain-containing protein [Micromonospora inositola]SCG51130.1 Repeat domain-containing protein [Micromonospora inositola]